MVNNGKGFAGFQRLDSLGSEFNSQSFLIYSILSKISTATLVQVKKVTNTGGVSAVGTVDILPLVNQIDANGNSFPHGKIYQCPYFRLQGGTNAIILDPQVGDIGIAIFADRDISSVIANKTQSNPQSNPGSRRRFDMADGLYIGGTLNPTPQQYIQFNTSGITITSNNPVNINCTNANITASGNAVIKATSIALQNAGTLLKKLVNETFLTLFDSHTHLYSPGGGTPVQSGAPATPSSATNKTSVTSAE